MFQWRILGRRVCVCVCVRERERERERERKDERAKRFVVLQVCV